MLIYAWYLLDIAPKNTKYQSKNGAVSALYAFYIGAVRNLSPNPRVTHAIHVHQIMLKCNKQTGNSVVHNFRGRTMVYKMNELETRKIRLLMTKSDEEARISMWEWESKSKKLATVNRLQRFAMIRDNPRQFKSIQRHRKWLEPHPYGRTRANLKRTVINNFQHVKHTTHQAHGLQR